MEYTLEDAFGTVKDALTERVQEIEDLTHELSENESVALSEATLEELRMKQQKLCQSLLNQVVEEVPTCDPVPGTSDLHIEVLTELEEEVQKTVALFESQKQRLSVIEEDISYLKNKKMGLHRMKQAYLEHAEMIDNTTYTEIDIITKHMFKDVKAELKNVVNKIFPENEDVIDFLADLTSSYMQSGDNSYIDVTPKDLHVINFLIEADIIMFHRNDKSKVKLMDML